MQTFWRCFSYISIKRNWFYLGSQWPITLTELHIVVIPNLLSLKPYDQSGNEICMLHQTKWHTVMGVTVNETKWQALTFHEWEIVSCHLISSPLCFCCMDHSLKDVQVLFIPKTHSLRMKFCIINLNIYQNCWKISKNYIYFERYCWHIFWNIKVSLEFLLYLKLFDHYFQHGWYKWFCQKRLSIQKNNTAKS